MLIADYIAQNGADTVAAALRASPAFATFNLCWQSPDDILPACNAMGLVTVEDAQAYAMSLFTAHGARQPAYSQLVRPQPIPAIDYASLPTTPWPPIHQQAFDAGVLAADLRIFNSDAEYRLLSDAQWLQLGAVFPGKNRNYSNSAQHDCDDYTREFQGWLASLGLGNTANGFCGFRMFVGDTFLASHAVVLVMNDKRELKFLEPQNGQLYPLSYTRFTGYFWCNRIEIALMVF